MNIITLKDSYSSFHTVIQYPDGQRSIKLHLEKLDVKQPVKIVCRIKNFNELEILICLVASLWRNDFFVCNIEFKYLFGLRSDRAFEIGQPNYCKDVLFPILNGLNVPYTIFEPHSLHHISESDLAHYLTDKWFLNLPEKIVQIVLAGDKSFADRGKPGIFINKFFEKKRDKDGHITSLHIDNLDLENVNSILIVDDMCDGGATFVAEAEYLKQALNFKGKIYLYVTHGLFTAGIDRLLVCFDHIYCTNSYQDIQHPQVTQYDAWGEQND